MNSSDTFSVMLNSLLTEEIALSGQLLEHIALEKELMLNPLAEELETTLNSKMLLLSKLQQVSEMRSDLMQQNGYADSPESIQACASACANGTSINQKFTQLSALAHDCHGANQMLGQLLNRKSGFFSRILATLTHTPQMTPLYQANGLQDSTGLNPHRRLSV